MSHDIIIKSEELILFLANYFKIKCVCILNLNVSVLMASQGARFKSKLITRASTVIFDLKFVLLFF